MKTCNTCKHWTSWGRSPGASDPTNHAYGECSLLGIDDPEGASVRVYDDSIPLCTDKGFGCIHHVPDDDPVRDKWEAAYPGITDNGLKLPIKDVIPGAFVHSMPVGYWPRGALQGDPWAWVWQNRSYL